MKTKDIESAVQENFEIGVDKIVCGELEEWEGKFVNPEMAKKSLELMGFKWDKDFETNE